MSYYEQTLNGQKVTPIPVIHEKSSGSEQEKEITALRFKIEQLEKQWLDEKRILEEQNKKQNGSLADCNKQIAVMKKENSDQSVLLSSSRNMLTEIKAKFDSSLSSWTTEKELLQKNIKQVTLLEFFYFGNIFYRQTSFFMYSIFTYITYTLLVVGANINLIYIITK